MRIGQMKFDFSSSNNNIGKYYNTDKNLYEITFEYPISHLGIQAYPGFTFVINNSNWDISIGKSGIYELNLEGIGVIKSITFAKFDSPYTEANTLLIDYVMEEGI